MKVKYVGKNNGAFGLQNGFIYEVTEVDKTIGAIRVITDPNDWNYDDDPDWKAGYLYSVNNPRPLCVPEQEAGNFYIVEDKNGQLTELGVLPLGTD